MRYVLIFLLLVLFTSCGGSSIDPQSLSLEVRVGKVNLDPGFFNLSAQNVDRSKKVWSKAVSQLAKIEGAAPLLYSAANPQKINFWVSFLDNGHPPIDNVELQVSSGTESYEKPLVYKKGYYWDDYLLQPAFSSDTYQVEVQYKGVSKKQTINLSDSTIAIPQNLSVTGSSSSLMAVWDPVPNASSYIYLIYDSVKQDFVYADLTKDSRLGFSGGGLNLVEGRSYEFWLLALNWDAFAYRDVSTSPPTTATASATVSAFQLGQQPPLQQNTPTKLSMLPGGSASGKIELKNPNNSPLNYVVINVPGTEQVSILSGAKGIIPALSTAIIEYKMTCKNEESDQTTALAIRMLGGDSYVPIRALCYYPPQILSFTANLSQINAGDSVKLSWQLSGSKPLGITLSPYISPPFLGGDTSGISEVTLWPGSTTEFELLLNNPAASVTKKLTVKVNPVIGTQLWKKDGAGYISQFPFSSDGQRLAYIKDGYLTILNSQTGAETATYNIGQSSVFTWSPDVNSNRIVYFNLIDNKLHIISSTTGVESKSLLIDNQIYGVQWSSEGILVGFQEIVSGKVQSRLVVWDPDKNTTRSIIPTLPNGYNIQGVPIWSPDRSKIALSDGGSVRILNNVTGAEISNFPSRGYWFSWSPDQKYLATANGVFDLASLKVVSTESDVGGDYQAFLPDGKRVLAGKYDALITSAFGGKALWKTTRESRYGSSVALSPDGTLALISWQMDGFTNLEVQKLGFGP